jgi:D-alanine-D-alanine ligase
LKRYLPSKASVFWSTRITFVYTKGMKRIKVMIAFGGESSEHDVSVMSARNVYGAIDKEKFDAILCYIDRRGKWWLLDAWQKNLENHGGVQLSVIPGASSFVMAGEEKALSIDVIFPVMHGENGHEDGAIQGLMQMVHIPCCRFGDWGERIMLE